MKHGNDPEIMPGDETTFQSYGVAWANLSNAPFREYKHFVHEGGIATPLIAHWPKGIESKGGLRKETGQLTDIMATIVDVCEAEWPDEREGKSILPCEGSSLRHSFSIEGADRPPLAWEHEGNCGYREGKWKLVKRWDRSNWELYDMVANRTETNDLALQHPELVEELTAIYNEWAERCGVKEWNHMTEKLRLRREELGDSRWPWRRRLVSDESPIDKSK